jgi:hypothetical protein
MSKYVVNGPHRVHEISPGEVIDLDPENPETRRLLLRGAIVRQPRKPAGNSSADTTAATSDEPGSES